MVVHHLRKDEARRIAIHAQLLDQPRPTDLVDVVDRLTVLQIDPTAAIAPSADLVLWSRLWSTYNPADLTKAIEIDRSLVETVAYIRAPRDLPAVIAEVREAEMHPTIAAWFEKNESFRCDIIDLLEKKGPLLSRDIPDTSVEPWPSSGWTNNRNVTKMLEILALRGYVAISAREGVSATGTFPSASIRRICRDWSSTLPCGSETSGVSPHSASPDPPEHRSRASSRTSVTRASKPSWT